MANTAPFSVVPGLLAGNNLAINSISVTTNGFFANTSQANTPQATANLISANNINANTVNFLSLVANLISQNVLGGNIETLKQLTSNLIFVNSISGNIATFGNVTANQFFINSVSGNNININAVSVNVLAVNSILHVGNATDYVNVHANAIYQAVAANSSLSEPLEVVLQTGSVSGTNTFTIDFSTEVTSNAYKSMKLIMSNIQVNNSSAVLRMRFSSDGSTLLTASNYHWSTIGYDDGAAQQQGLAGDMVSNCTIINNITNTSARMGCEIILSCTTTASRFKSYYGHAVGIENGSMPEFRSCGGWYESSIVLKGLGIFTSQGNFTSLNWMLIGYRY